MCRCRTPCRSAVHSDHLLSGEYSHLHRACTLFNYLTWLKQNIPYNGAHILHKIHKHPYQYHYTSPLSIYTLFLHSYIHVRFSIVGTFNCRSSYCNNLYKDRIFGFSLYYLHRIFSCNISRDYMSDLIHSFHLLFKQIPSTQLDIESHSINSDSWFISISWQFNFLINFKILLFLKI